MESAISKTPRVRVCAVSYLNTLPLAWGMMHGPRRDLFDLEFCLPAQCADRLAAGTADIGIVPSVELVRQTLTPIPGLGIACRGPVRSILLVSKRPPERIETLAVDSSSRTSVALARIILEKRFGATPRLITLDPDLPSMLEDADAALIIGDPALRVDPARLPYAVLDLGEEWNRLTTLPMVFAVWGCRDKAMAADMAPHFMESWRYGMARLNDIVRLEAPGRKIPGTLAGEYLTRNIIFELGPKETQGLRLFLKYAQESDTLVASGKIAGK